MTQWERCKLRGFTAICGVLALISVLPVAAAQNTSVGGQIIAPDGKPWAGIDVSIHNTATGEQFNAKTDKNGRYTCWGLRPGPYQIAIHDPTSRSFNYSELHMLRGTQQNDVSVNFSDKAQTPRPEGHNEGEEQNSKLNNVKAHFNVGLGAMFDAQALRVQLAAAPMDRKPVVQGKIDSDYQIAIREFQLAEEANSEGGEVKTQAMIWGHLGEAYDATGKYGAAVLAYEKAIKLQPEAIYYTNQSKAEASLALANANPKNTEKELSDADANCEKAATLDIATGARCWKNIGILLSNKGDMKGAIMPLEKTTQLDAKDALSWFLLGTALLATAETHEKNNVRTVVFSPEAAEAFRKCVDADPHGPYSSQAKDVLDELSSVSAGQEAEHHTQQVNE
jgi:tetratricopeptide (TPR) repeat protein